MKLPATSVTSQQQVQQATAMQNFDPNISEYEGTDGLPHQLWDPIYYDKRADFLHQLGIE
jgi:hypothetical protein